jgi:hypothetical protein
MNIIKRRKSSANCFRSKRNLRNNTHRNVRTENCNDTGVPIGCDRCLNEERDSSRRFFIFFYKQLVPNSVPI